MHPNLPVTCIDWCDAYAYCQWAGKRLCGRINGDAIPWNTGDDINHVRDEWYRACSRAGGLEFPYDIQWQDGRCNDEAAQNNELVEVGSTTCQGGYAGIFDMVGNAWEWENSCEGETGAGDKCLLRGGSWAHPHATYSQCRGRGRGDTRGSRLNDFGIRCCSR